MKRNFVVAFYDLYGHEQLLCTPYSSQAEYDEISSILPNVLEKLVTEAPNDFLSFLAKETNHFWSPFTPDYIANCNISMSLSGATPKSWGGPCRSYHNE